LKSYAWGKIMSNELFEAIQNNDLMAVKELIDSGADVNAKREYGENPLQYAAWKGHTEIAAFLIERRADVNARDRFRRVPLHFAARWGNIEVAKLLIEKGADVDVKDVEGDTPLHCAGS